jgi:hypothetical protein
MSSVGFTVVFHGPFRVGAAYARDGLGAAVDRDTPLPADHLKGLMRAAARDVLGLDTAQVREVFGGSGVGGRDGPCAWSWSAAQPTGGWTFGIRHRVAVDADSHTATRDMLVAAEYAYAESARFEVTLMGALPADRLAWHRLVLRATGAAVHGLGSWRRRGLGWVGIVPDDLLTDAEIGTLTAARPTTATVEVTR